MEKEFVNQLCSLGIILVAVISGCDLITPGLVDNETGESSRSRTAIPNASYPVTDNDPSWSPDGLTIAYTHRHVLWINRSGSYFFDPDSSGVWLVAPDGSNRRLFCRGARSPVWSPCGKELAVVWRGEVWRTSIDGRSKTQLTYDGEGRYSDISWSSDGSAIVLSNACAIGDRIGSWLMDPLVIWSKEYWGKGLHTVWLGLDNLIFVDAEKVWKERLDHSLKQVLVNTDAGELAASRDGSVVALSTREGSQSRVYVINSQGEDLRLISERARNPSFSPDGSRIVFVGWTEEHYNPVANGVLYVVNVDGSGKRQLTFGPPSGEFQSN